MANWEFRTLKTKLSSNKQHPHGKKKNNIRKIIQRLNYMRILNEFHPILKIIRIKKLLREIVMRKMSKLILGENILIMWSVEVITHFL